MLIRFVAGLIGVACIGTEVFGVYDFLIDQQGRVNYIVVGGCLVALAAPVCMPMAGFFKASKRHGGRFAAWGVFVLCLAVVVLSAISRTGEAVDRKEAERSRIDRATLLAENAEREAITALDDARSAALRECTSGRGGKCLEAETKRLQAVTTLEAARAALASIPVPQPDAVDKRLNLMFGVSIEAVQTYKPLLLPLGLFAVGTLFVSAAFHSRVRQDAPITIAPVEPLIAAPTPAIAHNSYGSLSKYLLTNIEHDEGSTTPVADILAGYRAWCDDNKLEALPQPKAVAQLASLFDRAQIATDVDGKKIICRDVKLLS